jgi:hypothetical protein
LPRGTKGKLLQAILGSKKANTWLVEVEKS